MFSLLFTACESTPPLITPLDGVEAGTAVCVVSTTRAESRAVADAYAACRRVPDTHRVVLRVPRGESMSREAFERTLMAPLVRWWRRTPPLDRPTYVLLCRGIPLRVSGRADRDGDEASVDSELTLLPMRASGRRPGLDGPIGNPYHASGTAGPFPAASTQRERLVLVTRLDGFSKDDAIALVERAAAARPGRVTGTVLVDHRDATSVTGDAALRRVETVVAASDLTLLADSSATFVSHASNLIAYAGWGSNDVAFLRPTGYTWVPGSVVATYVSTSARTFHDPGRSWRPGRYRETDRHFEGSPQSLLADWIRSGASAGVGYVSEPWLDGCVQPDVLIAAYVSGRTLGESAYLAMPYVSWRSIVIGDPLLRIR